MKRFAFLAISATLFLPGIHAQDAGPAVRFDVATIRLNAGCTGGGSEELSPGKFGLRCVSLRQVIRVAYGNVDRSSPTREPDVFGGPGWIDTDRYDIEASAPGNPGLDRMYGPMTKALLAERFQLKLHDEVRKAPVFHLTVLKNAASVKMIRDVSCAPIDLKTVLQTPPPPNYCGRNTTTKGRTTVFDGHGVTIPEFIERGLRSLDRPVIDMTRLSGRFDIHLEYVPTDALDAGDNSGTSVFTAVQEQLGLRLSAATGPVEVHVIDHVERPSPN
ncbi:MAG TPA: TIGR03435 family protein [Bryobacteraceae bacterium]|jgi:uncharacterized protein (TIGR03435 family)